MKFHYHHYQCTRRAAYSSLRKNQSLNYKKCSVVNTFPFSFFFNLFFLCNGLIKFWYLLVIFAHIPAFKLTFLDENRPSMGPVRCLINNQPNHTKYGLLSVDSPTRLTMFRVFNHIFHDLQVLLASKFLNLESPHFQGFSYNCRLSKNSYSRNFEFQAFGVIGYSKYQTTISLSGIATEIFQFKDHTPKV